MAGMDGSNRGELVPEYKVPILTGSHDDGHGDRAEDEPLHSASASGRRKLAGWTWPLVFTAIVTTLGAALPVGFTIGVINTPAVIIQNFCNESVQAHYDVALSQGQLELLWSGVVSVFLVGGMTGAMTGGWAADRLGRKRALSVCMVLSLTAALLFLCCRYANSVEMLLLARLVAGLSSGLTTSVMPMYLLELCPVHLSGALGTVITLGLNMGVFVSQFMGLDWVLGSEATWHVLLALFGPLVVVSLMLLPALPESPKYLYLVRGEEERGVRELSRIRRLPEDRLSDEIRALRMARKGASRGAADGLVETDQAHQEWTMARVLRTPDLLLPLVLVVALQAGQQFSGINAVFYYSSHIFQTAGLTKTQTQYATLGCGLINFLTSIVALKLVNGSGRRLLMLTSISVAVISMTTLGTSIYFIESVSWLPYVAIASVLTYVLFYGFGLGPIPFFIGSELFDVGPRPVGMAIGSLSNWGGNFVVGMSFTALQGAIGPASFYVFAAITTLQGILLKLYLPETKGRDATEVADMLRLGFKSKVLKNVKDSNASSHNSNASETS